MKNASEKYTILYARLSQDDGSQGDSNSIQNQRLMLEKYAKDNGFENLKFLSDDGYSGTNFNRPAFQELLGLVEDGQVATIIVKDMSRFGREYLQVGHYTEILFPSQGVRFIAMNDGVDSLYGDNEFTPFKNIINEWYAKDCSKKGRAAVRAKAETGARVGSRPPFGYMKDPNDPKVLSSLHQGDPRLITTGKIPEAHIVFLDEIFKCNDGVLNSLLTALNERKYTNEGRTYPIPTISFFAASNEIPNFNDPSEKILEALYDRLELKLVTENIEDRTNRLGMMAIKQQGYTMMIGDTITLDELYSMQQEVAKVTVPTAMNELADDICCELRRAGLKVSDRKLLNYAPIAQAMAWLAGRNTVTSMDLLALKWYLWQKPIDRQLVDATLERLCVNPLQDKVHTIRGMADEIRLEFEEAQNNASGTEGKSL